MTPRVTREPIIRELAGGLVAVIRRCPRGHHTVRLATAARALTADTCTDCDLGARPAIIVAAPFEARHLRALAARFKDAPRG